MTVLKTLWRIFIWPGTKVTASLGIDPDSEMGLLRSMFNSLFWTAIGLIVAVMIIL